MRWKLRDSRSQSEYHLSDGHHLTAGNVRLVPRVRIAHAGGATTRLMAVRICPAVRAKSPGPTFSETPRSTLCSELRPHESPPRQRRCRHCAAKTTTSSCSASPSWKTRRFFAETFGGKLLRSVGDNSENKRGDRRPPLDRGRINGHRHSGRSRRAHAIANHRDRRQETDNRDSDPNSSPGRLRYSSLAASNPAPVQALRPGRRMQVWRRCISWSSMAPRYVRAGRLEGRPQRLRCSIPAGSIVPILRLLGCCALFGERSRADS
jgi:hypothetical protein